MTEFLQSLKSDLLSRRLLPFVALLGVVLIAAAAYAATGGSSSSAPTPPAPPSGPTASATSALPVAVAPADPNQAVSETPAGTRFQSKGPTRDPFVPLPSPATTDKSTSPGGSSGSSAGTGGSSSGGGSAGSNGGQKAPVPAPKKPVKPKFPYIVSVVFGRASTTPGQQATLTPYENIKLSQPLPSKQDALISFARVTAAADGAVFTLVVPPILRGTGICLPSTSECQTIDLQVGHVEELEYTDASGQSVVYELKVVSIVKKSSGASTARAKPGPKSAQARFEAGAGQAIGQASAIRVVSAASATLPRG